MALTIPTRVTGYLITAANWNELVNGINAESVDLDTVQARTTDVSGAVGIGNQRLSDRLGAGVDNTTNVTTGTVTAQTTDLRSRVTTVESRTTNTSGNVGIGNQRLSDRLGAGVDNTTNVTTGTATAQLTDLRTRVGVVEATTTNTSGAVGIGNQRLSDRLGAGVDNTTNVTTGTVTAQTTDLRARIVVLEAAGTAVVPRLRARQANGATQSLTAATWTAITMTAEDQDNINGHSTSTNTSRYTPNVAGEYECSGMISANGTTTTGKALIATFWKNGATSLRSQYNTAFMTNQGFAANTCIAPTTTFQMNGTTDYIELMVQAEVAITTFANATDETSYMVITRIGP
jgi:hypothetical protein